MGRRTERLRWSWMAGALFFAAAAMGCTENNPALEESYLPEDAGMTADAGAPPVPDGGWSCDPKKVTCAAAPPACTGLEVAAVVGGCWGGCVDFFSCAPIPCASASPPGPQCPANFAVACHGTTQTCGPVL